MRRFSWFLVLLVLLKLSLGSGMAMPTLAHQNHPTKQAVELHACHGQVNASLGQTSQEDLSLSHPRADSTSHALNAADVDCHHCCAVGLAGQPSACLPPAPAVHAAQIQPDWLSVSLRPGLRPPIT